MLEAALATVTVRGQDAGRREKGWSPPAAASRVTGGGTWVGEGDGEEVGLALGSREDDVSDLKVPAAPTRASKSPSKESGQGRLRKATNDPPAGGRPGTAGGSPTPAARDLTQKTTLYPVTPMLENLLLPLAAVNYPHYSK